MGCQSAASKMLVSVRTRKCFRSDWIDWLDECSLYCLNRPGFPGENDLVKKVTSARSAVE